MSALRIPGPDGRTRLVVIDDGAVGRISHSLIKGGSIFGVMVTGHTKTGAEYQREHKARKRKDAA